MFHENETLLRPRIKNEREENARRGKRGQLIKSYALSLSSHDYERFVALKSFEETQTHRKTVFALRII